MNALKPTASSVVDTVDKPAVVSKTRVLADGTYATESAFTTVSPTTLQNAVAANKKPQLRTLLLGGDYFLGAVLATCMTKLVMRLQVMKAVDYNALRAEAMLTMTSIIRVGQSQIVTVPLDDDTYARIMTCLRLLNVGVSASQQKLHDIFLKQCHEQFAKVVALADKRLADMALQDIK